jgi:D-serine deaminase-like pyridoxal phosphate-dependent protein
MSTRAMTPSIDSFFAFEAAPATIGELETPVPVIDIDVVARNAERWQAFCDEGGIANRPHIKTHKLVALARYQLALGAKGITVQKLGEAEVMADAGISDMLLTFNVVGAPKLRRLAVLARRTAISVVADNAVVVDGVASAGAEAGRPITVLVECDTGAGRNGVQSPQAAADLAQRIAASPHLRYGGLMTYARPGTRSRAEAFLNEARRLAADAGLSTASISTGGSPDMWSREGLSIVTEYRAGTNIYYDRSLVARGVCTYADCALTVLATVVSVPTASRCIVDAGSKALTSDLLGLAGYGVVPGWAEAVVYDVNEEHGYLDTSRVGHQPVVGDRIRIVPNHVCPVTNLYDRVAFVRGEAVLGFVRVDARGLVS